MHKYALGQRSMVPMVEAAEHFSIGTNPHPAALYESSPGGLQIWCTPEDNPGGVWQEITMVKGGFCQAMCICRGGALAVFAGERRPGPPPRIDDYCLCPLRGKSGGVGVHSQSS